MARKKHSSPKRGLAFRGFAVIAGALLDAKGYLTNSYRPELHYMRGPGPKWQAKYGHLAEGSDAAA